MANSFPLSLRPAPPTPALAINLPFGFTSNALRVAGAADARAAAVVRAIAGAVSVRSPEIALRVQHVAREEPEKAVPPGASKPAELDALNKLIKAVDDAYGDTSKLGTITDEITAQAVAVGADARLVAVARDHLTAAAKAAGADTLDESAAKWAASINLEVFTTAARSGARNAGLALVPTAATDTADLRADFDKLSKAQDTLQKAHDALKVGHDALKVSHDGLRTDFDKLKQTHETFCSSVEAGRDAVSEAFQDLQKRVTALELGAGGGHGNKK